MSRRTEETPHNIAGLRPHKSFGKTKFLARKKSQKIFLLGQFVMPTAIFSLLARRKTQKPCQIEVSMLGVKSLKRALSKTRVRYYLMPRA
jgi:hypothetical protein